MIVVKHKKTGALLHPKKAASVGRRDSNEPGSSEWIIQTTRLASARLASLEHSVERWKEIVAELESYRVWERFPPETPYGSRDAYFRAEFGKPEPDLTRTSVEQGLHRSSRTEHIRARLRRDGQLELLEKLDRGQTSAHAVAIQLGWRTRQIHVPVTVPGFERAIRTHLNRAQIDALFDRLTCAAGHA